MVAGEACAREARSVMLDRVSARWMCLAASWILRSALGHLGEPMGDGARAVSVGRQLLRLGCLQPSTAMAEDWRQAVGVSRRSALRLAAWCRTHGCYDAVELQRVPGIGPATARRLQRLLCPAGGRWTGRSRTVSARERFGARHLSPAPPRKSPGGSERVGLSATPRGAGTRHAARAPPTR